MSMSVDAVSSSPASSIDRARQWWILWAVGSSMLLGSLDSSIVNISLPGLVQDMETDFATVQWVVLSYLLTTTSLLITMGRLGDLVGKRTIFQLGQIVFVSGSVLCGLSTTIHALIAFRVVQAIGASMLMGLGMAIITETWPPERRGQAIGISNGFLTLGVVAGPILGGVILEYLSWPWIFYINIPITATSFLICFRYLPPLRQTTAGGRFDFPGAVLVALGLTALCLLLTLSQEASAIPAAGWVGLGVVVLASLILFVLRERSCAHPMVDFSLFRRRGFGQGLLVQSNVFITLMAVILMLPFYLVQARGFPLIWVGLMQAAVPLVMTVIGPLAGHMSDRIGSLPLILVGLAGICAGYLTASGLSLDTSVLGYTLRLLPLGVGVALLSAATTRNIMSAAPLEQLGVASGIMNMMRTLSTVVGIPALSAFMVWRLEHYQGSPIDLVDAAPAIFIQGLRDEFLLCAAVVFCGLFYVVWTRDAHR